MTRKGLFFLLILLLQFLLYSQCETNHDYIEDTSNFSSSLQEGNNIFLPLILKSDYSQQYEEKILQLFTSDLLAYYPMSEITGTIISDLSGRNYHGNVVGSVQFGGRGIGIFPNSDSYIDIPTEMINQNLDNFTVMFFLQSTNEFISENLIPFIFYQDSNNYVYMARGRTTGNYASYHKGDGLLNYLRLGSINHTYPLHITISYTTTKGMKIYVNGTPSQYTPDLPLFQGLFSYARIGGNGGISGWQGYIHDFVILGREVTQNEAQIAAEYDNSKINFQFIAEGDSRTDGSSWVPKVHESIYDNQVITGYAIHAKSGSTLGTIESRAPELDEALVNGSNNILIVWAGVNNYTWSADEIHNALAAYCSARKTAGWTVIVSTEVDAQIEKVELYNWHDITWPNLNTLIRDNWEYYADALVDLGANPHLQDATDTTYFYDMLHLTFEGQNVVASEMIPVINSIIESKH